MSEFSAIDLSKARKDIGTPSFHEGPINGLDTETADGYPFAFGGLTDNGFLVEGDSESYLRFTDCLNFLTNRNFRSPAINFFYNLRFDVNAILKQLPRDQLLTLRINGELIPEWDTEDGEEPDWDYPYRLFYIPGKCLSIRDSNYHVYKFYDLAQFSYGSLESTADEWVEGVTSKKDIDVERFGLDANGELNPFIRNNFGDIIDYLRRDCELTRSIGQNMVETGQSINIPFGKPYSTGYISADFLRNRLDKKPGWGLTACQNMAWDAYRGGRFEVFERGTVEDVVGVDINSAYPNVLSQLPDPGTLKQSYESKPSINDVKRADYSFVDVTVTTRDRRIQPFAVKDDKVVYPRLVNKRINTIGPIFLFALENGYIEDYTLHGGAFYNDGERTRYPFQFINDLYDQRKTWESEGLDRRAKLLKIVLNSMYGKTCQSQLKREIIETSEQMTNADTVTNYQDVAVSERIEAGRLFNPFLASYITGLTRLQLHEAVEMHGWTDQTVMFATDCLMLKGNPDVSDLTDQDGLGGWDFEYQGDAFVVGSGVYQVEDNGTVQKQKTRGFRELSGNLRHLANGAGDSIACTTYHPVSYAQAIQENRSLEDVAQFENHERALSADFDDKRQWPGADFDDLLDGSQESDPLTYEEKNIDTDGWNFITTGDVYHPSPPGWTKTVCNRELDTGQITMDATGEICANCEKRMGHDMFREMHRSIEA